MFALLKDASIISMNFTRDICMAKVECFFSCDFVFYFLVFNLMRTSCDYQILLGDIPYNDH